MRKNFSANICICFGCILAASVSACVTTVKGFTERGKGNVPVGSMSEQEIALLEGLGSTTNVDIKVYYDSDRNLEQYTTFAFDYTSADNPILEKELFGVLREVLESDKFIYSEEEPDILVTMTFFTGKKEKYVPPKTITTTRVEEVYATGHIGWTVFGGYDAVPVVTTDVVDGYTEVTYLRSIRLHFLDYVELLGGTKPDVPPIVWVGEVSSLGTLSDIRDVAPVMLGELMDEFPEQSGRSPARSVSTIRCGCIGVKFHENDPSLITEVELGSVAEKAGLHPGDVILEVNGEEMPDSKKGRKASWNTPYLTHVIRAGAAGRVVLEVKCPHYKKKRTVEVVPEMGEKVLYR